jgi:glucose-6-phosphate dehydrogenase assembly protein OpcA
MASEETSPPSLSHRPMSSVLVRVEQELRDLWEAPAPGEPLPARVRTMNLVVVTGSPDVAERYTPIVDEVTQTIPSRAIVVTMTPNAPEASLDGEVSAIRGPDNSTCSERIALRATGAAAARVGSVVEALAVPELPTTLIWLGRVHTGDPVFRELAQRADRIVLDTEYTSLASLLSLSKWTRASRAKTAIADLAWTRTAVWREMCARFFDDPAMRPLALRVESLRIAQMSEKGARLGTEGALLLGWLATRLGWRIETLGGALQFRRADGKVVRVELEAMSRPEVVAPLAIAGVSLRASDGGVTAAGTVARDFHGDVADVLRYRLEVNLPCAGEQTVRLGANRGARVLERALHRPPHDEAFVAAVEFAEKLDDDGALCS